jgi:hypothetical protein
MFLQNDEIHLQSYTVPNPEAHNLHTPYHQNLKS